MFNFAIADGQLAVNPIFKTVALGEEAPRQRVLTDDEIRKIWSALDQRKGLVRKEKPTGEGRVFIGEPVSIALKLLLVTAAFVEISGRAIQRAEPLSEMMANAGFPTDSDGPPAAVSGITGVTNAPSRGEGPWRGL